VGAVAFIPVDVAEGAVESWREEVLRRRAITTIDPIADVFLYCASDLEQRLAKAKESKPTYTTREYAGVKGVRDSTVRKWIQKGQLEATKNAAGDWDIPRTAVRRKKK
jgi:excisionase family DNA binding protein